MKLHGLVSIIGETNSGKSTLINKLVDDKISIISHKVQTTRNQILGIYTNNNKQLIFIDTPGIFIPKKNIDSHLIKLAYSSLLDSDFIIVLIDSIKGKTNVLNNLLNKLKQIKHKNIILVLNKIDLFAKENKPKLLDLSNELYQSKLFKEVFMISALRDNGVNDLLNYLIKHLNKPGWLFSEEQTSNISLKFWATEITREKIFKYIHKELPYMIYVRPLIWNETENQIIIKQDILVSKQTHKKILIGKNGDTIKCISMASKKDLAYYLGKKVHLYLFIKVETNLFNKENLFINKEFY